MSAMAVLSPIGFLRRRFQSNPKDQTSTFSLDNVSEEENKKLKEDDTLFEFKDYLESHADNSKPTVDSLDQLNDDCGPPWQKGDNEDSYSGDCMDRNPGQSSNQETSEWTIHNKINNQNARPACNPVARTSEKQPTSRRSTQVSSRVNKGKPKGNMHKKKMRSDDGEHEVSRGQNTEQSNNQSSHDPLQKDYQAFGDTKRTEFNILGLYTAKVRASSCERGPEATPSDADIVNSLFDIAQETRESESPGASDDGRKAEGSSVDPLTVSQRNAASDETFCCESPGKRGQGSSVDYRSSWSTIDKQRSSRSIAGPERSSRSSDEKERSSHTLIDKETSSRTLVFKEKSSETKIDNMLSSRKDDITSLGIGSQVPDSFILGSTHLEVIRKPSTCSKTEGSSVDRKISFSRTCLHETATTDPHDPGSSVDSPVIPPYTKAKFRKTKLRAYTQEESETDQSIISEVPQTSDNYSSDDVTLTDQPRSADSDVTLTDQPRSADSQFFVVNKATVARLLSFGSNLSKKEPKVETLNVSTSTPKLQRKSNQERPMRSRAQPQRFSSGLVLNGMCSKCKTSCRAAASVLKDVCAPCRDKCQRLGVKPENLCNSCREKCRVLGLVLDNLCHSCKDELRALNVIKQELCVSCQATCRQVTLIVDNMCQGCRDGSRALKSLYQSRATKCRAMGAILEDNMCQQCRSKFRSLRDMTRRRIHSVRKKDFALDEIKKDLCQSCEDKVDLLFDINSTTDDITGDSFMEKVSLKVSKASSSCKESIGKTIRRLESRVREELAEEILAEMIETPLSPIAPGGDSSLRKDGEKIEDAGMYLAYAVIVIIILLNFAVYATFDGVGSYVPYFPST